MFAVVCGVYMNKFDTLEEATADAKAVSLLYNCAPAHVVKLIRSVKSAYIREPVFTVEEHDAPTT